jgi:hypothetical protein
MEKNSPLIKSATAKWAFPLALTEAACYKQSHVDLAEP